MADELYAIDPQDDYLALVLPELRIDHPLPLSMSDVLIESKELSLDDILANYQEITDAGPIAEKQGFQQPIQIPQKASKYALHYAAQKAGESEILDFIQQGYSVNQEDHYSTRPLHVAAKSGNLAAAKLFLKHGADVHDISYYGYSALHLALKYRHYDVAKMLVQQGHANPNQTTYSNQNAFTLVIDQLRESITHYEHSPSPALHQEIHQMIDTLGVFASHCGRYCHSALPSSSVQAQGKIFPVSLYLKVAAYDATDPSHKTALLRLADHINTFDPSESLFNAAKNILHVFPTGGVYPIFLDSQHYMEVEANGNVPFVATAMSKNCVDQFADHLTTSTDPLKKEVFNELKSIFALSEQLSKDHKDLAAAQLALDLYDAGKTLLLPTGWNGHFIDAILSKTQGLYGVANSGEGYFGNKSGTNFYKIADPNQIDVTFIHDVLNNQDQMRFEYDHAYQYGLLEKHDLLETPPQIHGNCTWQSQRDAVEGILYIELLNRGVDTAQAKLYAHQYYQEWDQFSAHFQLDNYFAQDPALPAKAWIDMLHTLHDSTTQKPLSTHEQACAQKIAHQLMTPSLIEECKIWMTDPHKTGIDKGLKQILPQYGIDPQTLAPHTAPSMTDMFRNLLSKLTPSSMQSAPTKHAPSAEEHTVVVAAADSHHESAPAPFTNIAHQLPMMHSHLDAMGMHHHEMIMI